MHIADRTSCAALVAETAHFPCGFRGSWHRADRAQLIYPSRGVMTISTRVGTWVVPPMRACWLPAAEEHVVESATGLEMRSVYCDGLARIMPERSGIVAVQPLLRELILALADMPPDLPGATPGEKLDAWLGAELAPAAHPPLNLPAVSSPALVRITDALRADPADARTLERWARELATTPRSLARAFAREAGMSFTEFRRQFRLHASLERLGQGQPVTTVAMDLGFSSAANFIAMFRRATGCTPKAYFARDRREVKAGPRGPRPATAARP